MSKHIGIGARTSFIDHDVLFWCRKNHVYSLLPALDTTGEHLTILLDAMLRCYLTVYMRHSSSAALADKLFGSQIKLYKHLLRSRIVTSLLTSSNAEGSSVLTAITQLKKVCQPTVSACCCQCTDIMALAPATQSSPAIRRFWQLGMNMLQVCNHPDLLKLKAGKADTGADAEELDALFPTDHTSGAPADSGARQRDDLHRSQRFLPLPLACPLVQ